VKYALEHQDYIGAYLATVLLQLDDETITLLKSKHEMGIGVALTNHLANAKGVKYV
jgi:hypothetical protein